MVISKHVYAIKELLNKGNIKNDYSYSNLFIAHYLEVYRSYMLNRKLQAGDTLQDFNFSTVCMEMEITTFENDCETNQCKILKSKHPLPNFLHKSLTVYYINGEVISHRTINQNKFNKYSIVKQDKATWFIFNSYLYIQNNLLIDKVILNGIFENLGDVAKIDCNCPNKDCSEDYEFYVDPALLAGIYQMVLQNLQPFNDETKSIPPLSTAQNNQADQENG